jgi:ribosomal protein S18 acetylase RimI-like enzyme
MRDDELAVMIARSEESYARQMIEFGGMEEPEAREKSARDHASLFPDGRVQDEHFVFAVDAEGKAIGWLVYALRAGGTKAWLYDVELDEAARGKGYGREAMRLFEEHARSRGVREIGLNVFAGNETARALYRRIGYRDASVWMIKPLDAAS